MRTRFALGVLVVVVALAVARGPLWTHHGWSGYDGTKTLTLTGVIKQAGYEHPHGFVALEVPGKVWNVVLAPPSRMESRGLPRTVLTAGTTAPVVGYPNRTDPEELRAERITIGGKTVELR